MHERTSGATVCSASTVTGQRRTAEKETQSHTNVESLCVSCVLDLLTEYESGFRIAHILSERLPVRTFFFDV